MIIPGLYPFCPQCKREHEVTCRDCGTNPRAHRLRRGVLTQITYCNGCMNKRSRASRAKRPDHYREMERRGNLRRRYGLTDEQIDMLGEVCRICGEPGTHVDHNHETGEVRGLLCHRCNTGLGLFRDQPELLHAAAEYLTGVRS